MSEITVLKFNEIEWAGGRFSGNFGTRGNAFINLKGRGPWLIECPTGSKPEQLIRIDAQAHNSFMAVNAFPVFSTDAAPGEDTVKMDYKNLFLSSDGTDQWPPADFTTGNPRPRGSECSLNRDTTYYFYVPELLGGHPSKEPGIKFSYVSTLSDDVEAMLRSVEMDVEFDGAMVPGVWTEKA